MLMGEKLPSTDALYLEMRQTCITSKRNIFYPITQITKQQTIATILYNKLIICKLIQPVGNVQNTEDTENNA